MKTRFRSIIALSALVPAALMAQQPATKDSSAVGEVVPTQLPPVDLSGVVFGNYRYEGDQNAGAENRFQLDRAYLTFKMQAGDRASVRVTTDIYQNSQSAYTLRAKYAYLNYNYFKSDNFKADARAGIIQTQFIDQAENFWPRYLAQVATERAGFFSSADVGVATLVSLPNKMGEVYVGVLNGSGYATLENDRFKDYTARVTLNPLSGSEGLLKSLALVGYYYKGAMESDIDSDSAGLKKDRWGFLAGIRDPRFTVAAEYNQRNDEYDTLNVVAPIVRGVGETKGTVFSVYGTAKPFQFMDKDGFPMGIVLRYDSYKPDSDFDGKAHFFVGGITFDLNKKVQFALDYQEMIPHDGLGGTPTKTYFAHWVANF